VKSHYELLEVDPAADPAAIKHAFRQQIARYHPDKVQHLGRDLQEMAAERTAALTEAYRVLSNPATREAYDQSLGAQAPPAAEPPQPVAAEPPVEPPDTPGPRAASDSQERSRRDDLLRRAAISRFRQAIVAEYGSVDDPGQRGFDVTASPRGGLFSRDRRPRILARFVDHVDGESLADAWRQAAASSEKDSCVFLMGSRLAAARELAEATARQRGAPRAAHVMVVPVDASDWQALVPLSAPPVVRAVLDRLRSGR
jgi:curved DNA-binding protein CbpA